VEARDDVQGTWYRRYRDPDRADAAACLSAGGTGALPLRHCGPIGRSYAVGYRRIFIGSEVAILLPAIRLFADVFGNGRKYVPPP
jgi:hypothetical protein